MASLSFLICDANPIEQLSFLAKAATKSGTSAAPIMKKEVKKKSSKILLGFFLTLRAEN